MWGGNNRTGWLWMKVSKRCIYAFQLKRTFQDFSLQHAILGKLLVQCVTEIPARIPWSSILEFPVVLVLENPFMTRNGNLQHQPKRDKGSSKKEMADHRRQFLSHHSPTSTQLSKSFVFLPGKKYCYQKWLCMYDLAQALKSIDDSFI